MRRSLFMIFALAGSVQAQPPLIAYRGIWNAASRMPAGLPGGAVSRGALFSITGRNIGPTTTPALATPPQATLGGVSIAVSQGTTTVAAIPIAFAPGRIDALMPKDAPLGMVSVRVTYNNARSNPMPMRVVATQFGIFTMNGAGAGPAVMNNVADDLTEMPNTLQAPAMPGQAVTLLGTGLGSGALEVRVGGLKATGVIASAFAMQPGVDAVSFNVPSDAPAGCWTPVYVKTAPGVVSNFATMAISADGTACQEPSNLLASALINGGNIGSYGLARVNVRHDAGVQTPRDAITDLFAAFQGNEVVGPANFNPLFSLPPAGSCTVYAVAGDLVDPGVHLPGLVPPTGTGLLDAGQLTVLGKQGTVNLSPATTGFGISQVQLGAAIPSLKLANKLFLDGPVNVAVAGGADIGAASGDVVPQMAFTWTNRDAVLSIDRTKAMALNWSGGSPDASTFVGGYATDMPANSTSLFLCMASVGSASFAVPADVMANLPVTRTSAIESRGVVFVGQWNVGGPVGMPATGLDFGLVLPIAVNAKTVRFQ